ASSSLFPYTTLFRSAGTFLHSIFEHLDFQDRSYWNLEIRRRLKNTAPQIWQELKEKFLQARQLRALLEQAFAQDYQHACVNLKTLLTQVAQHSEFSAEALQQSMHRVLSSLNYKILTGIRLHGQRDSYRQELQLFFKSVQHLQQAGFLAFLAQFQ